MLILLTKVLNLKKPIEADETAEKVEDAAAGESKFAITTFFSERKYCTLSYKTVNFVPMRELFLLVKVFTESTNMFILFTAESPNARGKKRKHEGDEGD